MAGVFRLLFLSIVETSPSLIPRVRGKTIYQLNKTLPKSLCQRLLVFPIIPFFFTLITKSQVLAGCVVGVKWYFPALLAGELKQKGKLEYTIIGCILERKGVSLPPSAIAGLWLCGWCWSRHLNAKMGGVCERQRTKDSGPRLSTILDCSHSAAWEGIKLPLGFSCCSFGLCNKRGTIKFGIMTGNNRRTFKLVKRSSIRHKSKENVRS